MKRKFLLFIIYNYRLDTGSTVDRLNYDLENTPLEIKMIEDVGITIYNLKGPSNEVIGQIVLRTTILSVFLIAPCMGELRSFPSDLPLMMRIFGN